jgi:hypothetical protein
MYKKPIDLYEHLRSIPMSRSRRRAAVANLERSETIMDLILKPRDVLRGARAGAARVWRLRRDVRCKDRNDYCGRLRDA